MFDTVKVGRIISQKRKEHNMTQMQSCSIEELLGGGRSAGNDCPSSRPTF